MKNVRKITLSIVLASLAYSHAPVHAFNVPFWSALTGLLSSAQPAAAYAATSQTTSSFFNGGYSVYALCVTAGAFIGAFAMKKYMGTQLEKKHTSNPKTAAALAQSKQYKDALKATRAQKEYATQQRNLLEENQRQLERISEQGKVAFNALRQQQNENLITLLAAQNNNRQKRIRINARLEGQFVEAFNKYEKCRLVAADDLNASTKHAMISAAKQFADNVHFLFGSTDREALMLLNFLENYPLNIPETVKPLLIELNAQDKLELAQIEKETTQEAMLAQEEELELIHRTVMQLHKKFYTEK